jgi:hypothetical protein
VLQAWFQYKEKKEKYQKVVEWVLAGSGTWEAWHKIYHDNRTPETGDWFVKSDAINLWLTGSSRLLVCHGDGTYPFHLKLIHLQSGRWQVLSYVMPFKSITNVAALG